MSSNPCREKVSPADPYIERIRYGRFKPHIIRVVLDLKTDVVPRTSTADAGDGHGYLLMLDVYPPDKAALVENDRRNRHSAVHVVTPPAKPVDHPHQHTRKIAHEEDALDHLVASLIKHKPRPVARPPVHPASVVQPQAAQTTHNSIQHFPKSYQAAQLRKPASTTVSKRVITIAIDPGHGGHDPGAVAKNGKGTLEKDITLSISKKLKKIIDEDPNMRAVLTRNGDYFLNLNQRQAIARKHNADLFVSIHADGSEKVIRAVHRFIRFPNMAPRRQQQAGWRNTPTRPVAIWSAVSTLAVNRATCAKSFSTCR